MGKGLNVYGGETGIRTLDTLRYTRFPSVRLQPLGHLSNTAGQLFEFTTRRIAVMATRKTESPDAGFAPGLCWL